MVTWIPLINTSTHLVWIETQISVFTIYETHRDGDDGDRDKDKAGGLCFTKVVEASPCTSKHAGEYE